MNNYKGYSLFNDVENKKLQAYNRVVTMFNVICDVSAKMSSKSKGEVEGTTYADHFTDSEKLAMKEMAKIVQEQGPQAARATFNA